MPSIFPDANVGGVTVLDALGNPTGAPGLVNDYIPPSTFHLSCALTFYGTNCTTTFFDPTIVNALASEMLAFAVALNPAGAWDCGSLSNLAGLFRAWQSSTSSTGLVGLINAAVARWMAANFNLGSYLTVDRGLALLPGNILQSDLGTGVRQLLT
jgi:hypothetical protein